MSETIPHNLLEFYCPFEAPISKDFDVMFDKNLTWARKFDLGCGNDNRAIMFAKTGAAMLAHIFPLATSARHQPIINYTAWSWFCNDYTNSSVPDNEIQLSLNRWSHIMFSCGAWRGNESLPDLALSNAFSRIKQSFSPHQVERFASGQRHWFSGMAWESAIRARGNKVSVNDYLAMRFHSVGADGTHPYIEPVYDIELTQKEWADPIVRAACEAAFLTAALDNDRYSYYVERDLSNKKLNIFDVIRGQNPNYSLAMAIAEGVTIRNHCFAVYLALKEKALKKASPELIAYFNAVDTIIRGNLNFMLATMRYNLSDKGTVITDVCNTNSDINISISPFAWWWEYL